MGIFRIFFIGREIRKGINDPSGFLAERALDFLKGFIIAGSLIGLLIVATAGVLGLTPWLGGPYGFIRGLFWVLLAIFALGEAFFISLFLKIKKLLKRNLDRLI